MKTFAELEKVSKDLSPIISVEATKNIPQFCQVNGYRDNDGLRNHSAWAASLIATADNRELNFLGGFPNVSACLFFGDTADSLREKAELGQCYDAIEEGLKRSNSSLTTEEIRSLTTGLDVKEKNDSMQAKSISVGTLQAGFLCTDLTLLRAASCANGVKDAVAIARPVDAVTVLPVWRKITNDPIYMKVFKSLSLKIVKHLKENTVPENGLLEDLKAEFFAVTKDQKRADDYAWDTMAALSAGGGNTSRRPLMINPSMEYGALSQYLHVLSNGAMALDRKTAEKGFLYTYPKDIKNLCDYGKNYHFWMTAYLARELKKKGYGDTAAAAAAFTVQKGYQFTKVGEGRYPVKPFTEASYSNYNNNIRLDLSLAASGAWYGALDGTRTPAKFSRQQVDAAIQQTFKNSKSLDTPVSVSESDFQDPEPAKMLSLYSDWKKVINPDEAFKRFENNTK